MIQLTRQQAIDRIFDDWIESFSEWDRGDIILHGMTGLYKYTNRELQVILTDMGDGEEYSVSGNDVSEVGANDDSFLREGIYLN